MIHRPSPLSTAPRHCGQGNRASIDSSMGEVIPIVTVAQVEEAWECYRSLVLEQQAKPALLAYMEHQKKLARANARWRRLFLQTEHAG